MLACRETVVGYNHYACSNPDCTFTKKIPFTCKCKACSSCGRKNIEIWMNNNLNIIPNTKWQHITFTMPKQLWDFFWVDRSLLGRIMALSVECIQIIANKKNVTPGIFVALHTFKRNLERNVHIHLSVTNGGISKDLKQWKKLYFHKNTLEKLWKYRIISLFRQQRTNKKLVEHHKIKEHIAQFSSFSKFLDFLYKKTWIIHCAKTSNNHKRNLEYFSRYTKRPPIAESKIKYYDGKYVTFIYRDHKTGKYINEIITVFEFIKRFIQHIPDIGFRMIRYYGFLANRLRKTFLNAVNELLGNNKKDQKKHVDYAGLLFESFGINPFRCPECEHELVWTHREVLLNQSAIPTRSIITIQG